LKQEELLLQEILDEDESELLANPLLSPLANEAPMRPSTPPKSSGVEGGDEPGNRAAAAHKVTTDDILRQVLLEADEGGLQQIRSLEQAEAAEKLAASSGDFVVVEPLREKRASVAAGTSGLHPEILSLERFQRISDQLSSSRLKSDAGLPSCISVDKALIAIGTSRGLVLLFNEKELMQLVLGGSGVGEHGPVSCVEFSPTSKFLVAGYQDGKLIVWDVGKGRPIKVVSDAHSVPVVHVFWIDERTILSGDTAGIVLLLTISNNIVTYTITKQRLLDTDSAVGAVLAMAPLVSTGAPHLANDLQLVAMCSAQMAFIVALKPEVNVTFKLKRSAGIREGAVPYLAWRRAAHIREAQGSGADRVLDPVVAVGWGKSIQLMQMVVAKSRGSEQGRLDIIPMSSHLMDHEVVGMGWLGEQVIVVLNSRDEVRLIDPFALEELQSASVQTKAIVYHTFFSTAETTEAVHHHSFRAIDNKLYMLGIDQVNLACVLDWHGRIRSLVQAGQWLQGLGLALDFYQGKASAVVGLPREREALQAVLSPKLGSVLLEYLAAAMQASGSPTEKRRSLDEAYFRIVGGVAIEFCTTIGQQELLFGPVFAKFCNAGQVLHARACARPRVRPCPDLVSFPMGAVRPCAVSRGADL
jgi:hypothetical protein